MASSLFRLADLGAAQEFHVGYVHVAPRRPVSAYGAHLQGGRAARSDYQKKLVVPRFA